jgi:hypothetical protein
MRLSEEPSDDIFSGIYSGCVCSIYLVILQGCRNYPERNSSIRCCTCALSERA